MMGNLKNLIDLCNHITYFIACYFCILHTLLITVIKLPDDVHNNSAGGGLPYQNNCGFKWKVTMDSESCSWRKNVTA